MCVVPPAVSLPINKVEKRREGKCYCRIDVKHKGLKKVKGGRENLRK